MRKVVFAVALSILTWAVACSDKPRVGAFDSPIKWVAFGDSITEGAAASPGHSFVQLLEKKMGTIDNKAVSGSMIEAQLQHINAYTGTATNVIWLSGYNDARYGAPLTYYEDYLRLGLEILQQRGDKVYLGTCLRMTQVGYQAYPPEWNHSSDEAVASIIATQRRVAANFPNVVMAETSALYNPENVSSDLIHPNDAGHAQIAEAFMAAIWARNKFYFPIVEK